MTETMTPWAEAIAKLKLYQQTTFIPFSASRHAKDKYPSLNWKVKVFRDGTPIIETEYTAGSGHCPSYKQGKISVDEAEAIRLECERGKPSRLSGGGVHTLTGAPYLEPKFADVLYSLLSDASAIDYPNFEAYAKEMGMNADSRADEAIYRACVEVGLSLRAVVGEAGLALLREAFQDY